VESKRDLNPLSRKHGLLGPTVPGQSGSRWISRITFDYSGLGRSTGEKNYDALALADVH